MAMDNVSLSDLEARARRLEDEAAIRDLAARFTDAVNQRDPGAFSAVWSPDAIWEIGPPFGERAEGVQLYRARSINPHRHWYWISSRALPILQTDKQHSLIGVYAHAYKRVL